MKQNGYAVISLPEYDGLKKMERETLANKTLVEVVSYRFGIRKYYYSNDETIQDLKKENDYLANKIKKLENKFNEMNCWQFLKWKFGKII